MAESEAMVRGEIFDGGGGLGARAMMGGSLPPRKRLLAGMKQNGAWLAASSPASTSTPTAVQRSDRGGTLGPEAVAEVRSPSGAVTGEAKGGCTSCGAVESSAWRRVKRNGVVRRLCNLCALLFNKNMNCPHCLVVYPDVKDPAIWHQCSRCQRPVHVECEKRCPSQLHAGPYVCSECIQLKKCEEHPNGLMDTGAAAYLGSLGEDCGVEAGNCASSAAADCTSPCSKRTRVSRESGRYVDVEADDAGNFEGMHNVNRAGLGRKGTTSQEAAAAAAAAAAALAGRAAVAAKASAAAKAATAVKAAAAAKAALDAAALAARGEAQARVELRRRSVSSECTVGGVLKLDATLFQPCKEKSEEPEVTTEEEEIPAIFIPSSINDEDLARQLHRAINSSPRISSGLTPLRRKSSVTPGAIVCTSPSVISWSRVGLSVAGDPRPQSKHQLTKPRSIYQKEAKRIDTRVVQIESKPSGGNCSYGSPQQPVGKVASGNARHLVALKSEPVNSSTVILVRPDSGTQFRQGAAGAPLKAILKTENDFVNGSAPQLFDNRDLRLSATDLSQAAAMLDDVLMSEADVDEVAKGQHLPQLRGSTKPHANEDYRAATALDIEGSMSGVHGRQFDTEEREPAGGGCSISVSKPSCVAAVAQVPSSAMVWLEDLDESTSAALIKSQRTACSGDNL